MDVFLTNIGKIYDDLESFVIVKGKLEKELIKQKKIEKKLSLAEFIAKIDFTKSISYIDSSESQKIKNINIVMHNVSNDELLVFYVSTFSQEEDDWFFNKLKDIDYNLIPNLTKIKSLDIFTKNINKYFIINGDFYIEPEDLNNTDNTDNN